MSDFKNGSVKISNDIIDQLVAESALKVEGVHSVVGYKNGKFDGRKKEALIANVEDNSMQIKVTIVVKEGENVYEVAENVQKNVKEQIHTILAFEIDHVDVFVKDIA